MKTPRRHTFQHPGAPGPQSTRQPATIARSGQRPQLADKLSSLATWQNSPQLPEIFDPFHPARDPTSQLTPARRDQYQSKLG